MTLGAARTDGRWPSLVAALALVAVAVAFVVLDPWHGRILLALVPDHGVDVGDLLVLPLLGAASWLVARAIRASSTNESDHGGAGRAAASVLLVGALLTVIGGVRLVGWGGPARTVRYLAAGLLAVALVWLGWELATGSSLTLAGVTKRAWVVTFAVVVVGSVADTLFDPSGTVFGIAAAAAYLATRTRSRGLTATLLLLAVVLLGLTVASLADIAGIDVSLSNDGGGAVRAMALGVLLMIVGLGARCEQVAARAT